MERTLPEIAQLLGIGLEGLRLLRHFAHPNSAILRPCRVLDGRKTGVFDTQECFRAALALALSRQGLTVPVIRAVLDAADAGTFKMRHAVAATIDRQAAQLRILTRPDGSRECSYALAGDELSLTGEAYLVVALHVVWDPLIR
jgi:hypothetical protein